MPPPISLPRSEHLESCFFRTSEHTRLAGGYPIRSQFSFPSTLPPLPLSLTVLLLSIIVHPHFLEASRVHNPFFHVRKPLFLKLYQSRGDFGVRFRVLYRIPYCILKPI